MEKYEKTVHDLVAKMCKAEHWTLETAGQGWRIEIPQPKGRKQKVVATAFMDGADQMIRYTSMIGESEKMDLRRAMMVLELNAKMPHGCLAIEGGHLMVTETRPLKIATTVTSAAVVRYLAKQADTYERLFHADDKH